MEKIFNLEILKQVIRRYFEAAVNKLQLNEFPGKNLVLICGIIKELPQYTHTILGERFYDMKVSVPRNSGVLDILPVTISERMLDIGELSVGQAIALSGQLRSYNFFQEDNRSKLLLKVFAREVSLIEPGEYIPYENTILLDGYTCKESIYRLSPQGREISDLMLAVGRNYNKSDYIPTVAWGRCARYCANMEPGERLIVVGRVQSRDYEKLLETGESVTRTAYEVSILSLAAMGQNNRSSLQDHIAGEAASGF